MYAGTCVPQFYVYALEIHRIYFADKILCCVNNTLIIYSRVTQGPEGLQYQHTQ